MEYKNDSGKEEKKPKALPEGINEGSGKKEEREKGEERAIQPTGKIEGNPGKKTVAEIHKRLIMHRPRRRKKRIPVFLLEEKEAMEKQVVNRENPEEQKEREAGKREKRGREKDKKGSSTTNKNPAKPESVNPEAIEEPGGDLTAHPRSGTQDRYRQGG
jgi:hypothetical protein